MFEITLRLNDSYDNASIRCPLSDRDLSSWIFPVEKDLPNQA